jgi:hypothetical protein
MRISAYFCLFLLVSACFYLLLRIVPSDFCLSLRSGALPRELIGLTTFSSHWPTNSTAAKRKLSRELGKQRTDSDDYVFEFAKIDDDDDDGEKSDKGRGSCELTEKLLLIEEILVFRFWFLKSYHLLNPQS